MNGIVRGVRHNEKMLIIDHRVNSLYDTL